MFDAIAPRYDLVNRIMTFRLDVRWRRRAVRSLSLPPAQPHPRPRQRHRRPLRRAGRRRATARCRSTSASACSPPTAAARRASRPTSCACRCPTASVDGVTCGFALRNLVDLGRVLRRARPRSCAPAGASPCSTSAIPHNRLVRWGHGIYFGKVVPAHRRPAVSDAAAYRYLPRSVAYLPPPDEMLGHAARGRVRRRRPRRAVSGGITQLLTGTRVMRAVTPSPTPLDRGARPQRRRRRRRLPVRARRRRARRARRRRPGRSTHEVAAALAAIDHDDRGRRRRRGPVAIGWVPYDPARRRADHARRHRRASRPTAAGWSP